MEHFIEHHLQNAFTHLNWLWVLVAILLGALHSLEPGHGKALISIYFIGKHRTLWDVLWLALIVAFTHTFSVLALAGVSAWLLHALVPGQLMMTGVEIAGGAAIVGIGVFLWARAQRESHARHFHTEASKHHHDCERVHGARSMGELLTLGVVAGLVPCPIGVAIVIEGLTTGRIASSVILTLAFSAGVGLLIFCIGLSMWRAMKWTEHFFKKREAFILRLPKISSLIIIAAGAMALSHGVLEMVGAK